jgi:hypothetical protein
MVSESDIPDWCFAEGGLAFDFAAPHIITPEGIKL